MINNFFNKLVNIPLINSKEKKVVFAALAFLILNALKITLFNYFILPVQTTSILDYKFLITVLLVLAIYPVIFKIKSRIIFVAIYLLQGLYIIVNISYYLYFHNYLHILQWITLFKEASQAAGHFAAPNSAKFLIVLIDLPALIYIIMNYSKLVELNIRLRFQRLIITALCLFVILCIEVQNYACGYSLIQYTSDEFRGESPIVERYGTVANNIISLYSNLDEKNMINKLNYGKEQSNVDEATDKPNFVMIQVESMDSNVINQKYKGQYIAPFLHSLSGQSVYYPYTMSYHSGGGTSDSEFSIMNSVEPLTDYPAIKLSNYNYPNSMINSLSKAGYSTEAFHGNVGDFYNRDVALPKMGFENFFDMNKMNMENVGWGAPDGDVFNYTFNYLKNVKQPFASYNITMTSHGPFTNARNYYNNTRYDGIKDTAVKDYFNSMSYVDQSIKDFVTKIQANFKNTYVLIWGDHTPHIDTDIYKQASFNMDNKYFEFVPLIIVTPDKKVYKEDKKAVSFLDISPTILSNSGIKFYIKSDGEDLLGKNGLNADITFKGGVYSRESIFNRIEK